MRPLAVIALVATIAGCNRGGARGDSVDTAMVFVAAPAPAPGDSVRWQRSLDSVHSAFASYSGGRISADSMAKVIVHYIKSTGRPLNISMDDPLRAAVRRRM